MFQKIIARLKEGRKPVEPRQGKRLSREQQEDGSAVFEIRGKGRPGFFIIFGGMFLGIPSILLFAIFFGTPSPGSPSWGTPFAVLFLIPFFVIGLSTFFIGVFLWLGKTRLTLGQQEVRLERILLKKTFQTKLLTRQGLEVRFEKSHEENDVSRYKLALESGEKKIGIGGSLKEEELLWLDQEIRLAAGEEAVGPVDIGEAIRQDLEAEADNAELDRNYRSKKLNFTRTAQGWEAHTQNGFLGSIFIILFGSIFLGVGLLMEGSLAEYLKGQFEWFRKMAENSTGDSAPIWAALLFAGAGAAVISGGIWSLGYRMKLEKRHARLRIIKTWFSMGTTRTVELSNIQDLKISKGGDVNEEPRFKLLMHLKHGKKVKLLSFATSEDVGQLKAWLEAEAPSLSDKTSPPDHLDADPGLERPLW
ncbi:MAG: hypothetical protein ACN4GG_10620 [Akkermansiaceae bacterium]